MDIRVFQFVEQSMPFDSIWSYVHFHFSPWDENGAVFFSAIDVRMIERRRDHFYRVTMEEKTVRIKAQKLNQLLFWEYICNIIVIYYTAECIPWSLRSTTKTTAKRPSPQMCIMVSMCYLSDIKKSCIISQIFVTAKPATLKSHSNIWMFELSWLEFISTRKHMIPWRWWVSKHCQCRQCT